MWIVEYLAECLSKLPLLISSSVIAFCRGINEARAILAVTDTLIIAFYRIKRSEIGNFWVLALVNIEQSRCIVSIMIHGPVQAEMMEHTKSQWMVEMLNVKGNPSVSGAAAVPVNVSIQCPFTGWVPGLHYHSRIGWIAESVYNCRLNGMIKHLEPKHDSVEIIPVFSLHQLPFPVVTLELKSAFQI